MMYRTAMPKAKVAVTLEAELLDRVDQLIAVALTSQEPRAGFPLTVESKSTALPKRSWVRVSQIRTLAVERIGRRLAKASDEEVARVVEGLDEIIG